MLPARSAPNTQAAPVVAARSSATLLADMDEAITDEVLMLRYRGGDAGAFDQLYTRHRGGVYRYLLRQLRDHAVAEELFQDIWMNLINARERYVVQAQFKTWLYRIAHNRLVDHVRRQGDRQFVSLHGHDDEDDPPPDIADAETNTPEARQWAAQQLERVVELVEALPAAQREAFLLHHEGDLNIDAIAEATGVNRETAKSRLRYALNKLRQGLEEYL
ncbi:MAG: RNA polymerase sigma factor [Gammaproteobacteria bacterium]